MVRKMLVTLDGSAPAESVLSYLDVLLRLEDANVTLVRVTADSTQRKLADAGVYLSRISSGLRRKGAVVDTAVLTGSPAEAIVQLAEAEKFDLIVMTTHARKGLRRLVFGSVTEAVLRTSRTPVLVVHPRKSDEPAPRIERIVVPLDGSHRAGKILGTVTPLAKAAGATIYLLTAVSPTGKETLPVEVCSKNIVRQQKELQKQGIPTELFIHYGEPGDTVRRVATERQAQLLAITTHGRTGLDRVRFGSVAEELLRNSPLPVLVVRTVDVKRKSLAERTGTKVPQGRRPS